MTQYILDTDHITLLQHSNPLILQRFETLHTSDVAEAISYFDGNFPKTGNTQIDSIGGFHLLFQCN